LEIGPAKRADLAGTTSLLRTNTPFPLTPTLSLGEREKRRPHLQKSDGFDEIERCK
jgi:hypothetical protein